MVLTANWIKRKKESVKLEDKLFEIIQSVEQEKKNERE